MQRKRKHKRNKQRNRALSDWAISDSQIHDIAIIVDFEGIRHRPIPLDIAAECNYFQSGTHP